jgi:hypothetical protein
MKNNLTSFLIFCSGVNKSILKRCPSDITKYCGIGATVLFTSVLALFTGSYAIYSVFDNYFAAAVFAILWALIIFNLDRYIVSTMKKKDSFSKEFLTALPRIILAVFISIVISKPLEIAIFQSRIDAYMLEHNEGKKKEMSGKNKVYIYNSFDKQIAQYKQEITTKESTLPITYQVLQNKLKELGAEKEKTQKIIQKRNDPLNKQLKILIDADQSNNNQINALQRQISINNSLITPITNQIATISQQIDLEYKSYQDDLVLLKDRNNKLIIDLETKRQAKIADLLKKEGEGNGIYDACTKLPDKISAMGSVCSNDQTLNGMSWFIILLLICIETAPVFTKLITSRSPYDDLLQIHEYNYTTKREEEIARLSATTKNRIQIALESGNYSALKEVAAKKEITNKIMNAEMEVTQEILEKYKELQKIEISKNIGKYVTLSVN